MPRAAPSYVGTRTLSSKFTAKCQANQPLVDKLAEKRDRAGSSNFGYTLKRAAESICKVQFPITKFEEAIALKGVGPSIATSLGFSKSFGGKRDAGSVSSGNNNNRARGKKAPPSRSANNTGSTIDSPSTSVKTTTSSVSGRAQKPKPRQAETKNAGSALPTIKENPTKKELAYQKAVQEAEIWKGMGLKWRLVLLIDQRERKAEHYSSKVQQCGIPTDIRSLPIGDMCWIAQGFADNDETRVLAELMLGTIIERKEVADLKSSLFGTRYHEQQLRLKESGQPQVIFLVEGDTRKDLYRCPAETLHSTMWAIRIEKQNQVIQTAHTEETVQTLRRMHRRMLQRTFPSAFYSEALPEFSGPDAGPSRGRRQRDSFGEKRRKRRRRLESLHGLIFDEDPIPMAGMSRFVSYQELRAKVERDREVGRRTVGSIHQGMLKQVATISDTKIVPISNEYPTANALLQAYNNVPTQSERKQLLEGLDISGNTVSAGRKTLGPRSAEELYIAYGMNGNRRDSIESQASASSRHEASTLQDDVEDAHLQTALAASLQSVGMQPAFKKPSSKVQGSAGLLPEAVSLYTKSADVASRPNNATVEAKKSSPKEADMKPKASKRLLEKSMVDLLSSDDDDDNNNSYAAAAAAPAKRSRFSLSSDDSPSFAARRVPQRAAALSMSSLESSDDEDLAQILGGGLSKDKQTTKPAESMSTAAEVIEID